MARWVRSRNPNQLDVTEPGFSFKNKHDLDAWAEKVESQWQGYLDLLDLVLEVTPTAEVSMPVGFHSSQNEER